MYFSIATLAFLAYTGLTAASTCNKTPSSDTPSANTLAIYTPGQNQIVPVDRPFTITWDPTAGITSVSIVLLQGPSTNVVPLSCIVNSTPNTGTFIWTPSSSLTPTGNSGYGLQIIDDSTGKFQYSTQFGISNPDIASSSTSSSTSPSGTITATSHPTHTTTHITKSQYLISSSHLLLLPSTTKNSTKNTTHSSHHHKPSSKHLQHIGTALSGRNATTHFVTPTGSMTKPSSLGPVTSVVVAQSSSPVVVASGASSVAPAATTTTSKSAAVAGGRRVGMGMAVAVVVGLGGVVAVFL